MLHPVLQRQLRKLGLDETTPPTAGQWHQFTQRINQTYVGNDEDRYLIERSLTISSREMQELYESLRRSSETQLALERDKLQAIISSLGDGLCVLDQTGNLVLMNPAAEHLLGFQECDLLGKPILDIVECHNRETRSASLETIGHGGEVYRNEDGLFRRRDGSTFPVAYVLNPIVHETIIGGFVLIFRNTSERKQAELALRENLERNTLLYQIASNPDKNVEFQLNEALRIVTQKLGMELGLLSHVADQQYTIIAFYSLKMPIRRGQQLDLGDTYCKITLEEGKTVAIREIGDSEYQRHPCYKRNKLEAYIGTPVVVNGQSFGTLSFTASQPHPRPFSEADRNFVGLLGQWISSLIARTQADQKLKRYAANLEQSNRELQDFAYVASHDLQEPLRKIQAFGGRLQSRYGEQLDDRGVDYLQRMNNAAARMQTLIQDLLSLSRVSTRQNPFTQVDLNIIVAGVVSDLELKIEQSEAMVEIGRLPTIDADATQMRQLFQNLIGNALKFGREDVLPSVKVIARYGESSDTMTHETVQIHVEDNGIGFDEKYLSRIFNIFQRLHGRDKYEGTGVGLAICRKIVERHQGNITAKSQLGAGATFIVTLPCQQQNEEVPDEV